jgi:hypothetical protein
MPDFAGKLTYYETKCRQHLSRVRLSHVLALGALKREQARSDGTLDDLIFASFGSRMQDVFEPTLRSVLHELHLVSLKANFELFLNRLLWTMWTFYFADLVHTIPAGESVSLRELAESFEQVAGSGTGARDLVIDRMISVHGLHRFETALKQATNIQLRDVLNHENFRYWPQIYTTFEVRHLVEHRDGQIDSGFRARLRQSGVILVGAHVRVLTI